MWLGLNLGILVSCIFVLSSLKLGMLDRVLSAKAPQVEQMTDY